MSLKLIIFRSKFDVIDQKWSEKMKISQIELLNESQFLLKKSANIERHQETLSVEKQILKERQKELESLKLKRNEQELQKKDLLLKLEMIKSENNSLATYMNKLDQLIAVINK